MAGKTSSIAIGSRSVRSDNWPLAGNAQFTKRRGVTMPICQDYTQFLSEFHSDKFQELWTAQAFALERYSEAFWPQPDLAIELTTGGGKTLIVLLVGEAWRKEGKSVAILSANKTLARQMIQESQALGIPAVLIEGKGPNIPSRDRRAFQRAECVAIMNY